MTNRDAAGARLPRDVMGAVVRAGAVPDLRGSGLIAVGPPSEVVTVRADRSTALIEVPGVARYLVETGRLVTVDAAPDVAPERLRTWLHGTVAAFVAAHQGRFALHASVVEVGGRRIAVAGETGAGKSTTVLAVAQQGGALVSDDVAVLEPMPDAVVSIPYGRRVHATQEAVDALGIRAVGAEAVAPDADKVALPAPPARPGAVHDVVVLRRGAVATPRSRVLTPLDAVRAIRRHTFRRWYLEPLYADELFAWQVAVANRTVVHRLVRPETWSVPEVAAEIGAIARGGVPTHGARG